MLWVASGGPAAQQSPAVEPTAQRDTGPAVQDVSWDSAAPVEFVVGPDGRRRVRGELIVGLQDWRDLPAVAQALSEREALIVGGIPGLRALRVRLSPRSDELADLSRFASIPGLRYVQVHGTGGFGAVTAPDDTWFEGSQWWLDNTGQGGGTPGADAEVAAAWDLQPGSASVVVAVLDTGTDHLHPELSSERFLFGEDFVDEDGNPQVPLTGSANHGVYVTGQLAAEADNAWGVAGVDPRCTVLPIRVGTLPNDGVEMDLAQALDHVAHLADPPVDVVSMSLVNWDPGSQLLQDALGAAHEAGVILVACGGNDGAGHADLTFPGSSPLTIEVGWTDRFDVIAPGLGQVVPGNGNGSGTGASLDFVAPGFGVYRVARRNEGGVIGYQDLVFPAYGCSFATPVVAGIVSLMKGEDPSLTQSRAYEFLRRGAEDQVGPAGVDAPGRDDNYGHGRVNALHSLVLLRMDGSGDSFGAGPSCIVDQEGRSQFLALDAGLAHRGRTYLIVGSASGTVPGIPFGPVTLPLNVDGYMRYTLQNLDSPILSPSFGVLDEMGRATARFTITPEIAGHAAGADVSHAFVVFDGSPALESIRFVSNPVSLHVAPPGGR